MHYEPQQSKVIVVTTDSGTSPHHVNYQHHSAQEPTDTNENQYIEETIGANQSELVDLPPLQSYRVGSFIYLMCFFFFLYLLLLGVS